MSMNEHVYSSEYEIVIVEEEEGDGFDRYMIYVKGEWVGTAFDAPEAREMAAEVLASVSGDEEAEGAEF